MQSHDIQKNRKDQLGNSDILESLISLVWFEGNHGKSLSFHSKRQTAHGFRHKTWEFLGIPSGKWL